MNIFDKARIQTALGQKHRVPLDSAHTTTSDFFQLNIPYVRDMIPGEKLEIDMSSFARLDGMPLPTFGDANLNLRAFFVPYRMISRSWLDFYEDTPHSWGNGASPSIPSHVPLIRNNAIVKALASETYSRRLGIYEFVTDNIVNGPEIDTILPLPASQFNSFAHNGVPLKYVRIYFTKSSVEYYGDFVNGDIYVYKVSDDSSVADLGSYTDVDGVCTIDYQNTYSSATINRIVMREELFSDIPEDEKFWDYVYKHGSAPLIDTEFMVFTPFGKNIYKVLRQLGYAPYFDLTTESNALMSHHNALRIFAWLKVWLDYYFPAQYYGNPIRTDLELFLTNDTPDYVITDEADVLRIFNYCSIVCYASDYLTAAFDHPVGPTDNAVSPVAISDKTLIQSGGSEITLGNNGTPYLDPVGDGEQNVISQFALMALRKLTDYMKRHQLAGARAVDRFYAQFAMKMDNNAANRSFYLGSHHVPMQVGDVMATADTMQDNSGAALGDYAGKGFLIGPNAHFEFDSGKDFGIFLICSSLIPKTRNYQGYDIQTLKKQRLDFFNPEFDGMSTRALEKGEVIATRSDMSNMSRIRGAFGFTPLYAEYKIPVDRLTGDFNVRSVNKAGFTSNAWHLFREFDYDDYANVVHNPNFVFGNDWRQYLRIFYNVNDTADHFVLNYLFKVTSFLPAKPLYDSYEFEHDNGHEVDVAVNGQRVN